MKLFLRSLLLDALHLLHSKHPVLESWEDTWRYSIYLCLLLPANNCIRIEVDLNVDWVGHPCYILSVPLTLVMSPTRPSQEILTTTNAHESQENERYDAQGDYCWAAERINVGVER